MSSQNYQFKITAICYFEGTGLDCLMDFNTIEEFEAFKGTLTAFIAKELRRGVSMDTIKSQSLETLHHLHQEILDYVGDGEFTLKKIKKLWKDDLKTKCSCWYMLVSCLIKLRVFNEDNMYGWQILTPQMMSILQMNGRAEFHNMETKKCQVCQKNAYDKCSKCRTAYYCCGTCQTSDWKEHKKVCCK